MNTNLKRKATDLDAGRLATLLHQARFVEPRSPERLRLTADIVEIYEQLEATSLLWELGMLISFRATCDNLSAGRDMADSTALAEYGVEPPDLYLVTPDEGHDQ
jgi:hypothetical protein